MNYSASDCNKEILEQYFDSKASAFLNKTNYRNFESHTNLSLSLKVRYEKNSPVACIALMIYRCSADFSCIFLYHISICL